MSRSPPSILVRLQHLGWQALLGKRQLLVLIVLWLLAIGGFALNALRIDTLSQTLAQQHHEHTQTIADTLTAQTLAWQQQVQTLAGSAQLRAWLSSAHATEADAQAQLHALWPTAQVVCVLSPVPNQPSLETCLPIGFASLMQLRANLAGEPAKLAVMQAPGTQPHILLSHAVMGDAVLLVAIDVAQIQMLLDAQQQRYGGYIELKQGDRSPWVVARSGSSHWQLKQAPSELAIPDTHWTLHFWSQQIAPAWMLQTRWIAVLLSMLTVLWAIVVLAVAPRRRVRQRFPIQALNHPDVIIQRETPAEAQAALEEEQARLQAANTPICAPEIFKRYDIRGVVDTQLTQETMQQIGRAIGSEIRGLGRTHCYLGRDGRLSSEALSHALATGLQAVGCTVIDLGQIPSPLLYFVCAQGAVDCGVIVTGSHNPPQYNGVKLILAGEAPDPAGIQALYQRLLADDCPPAAEKGARETGSIIAEYIQQVTASLVLQRPLKVVVDAGNAVAGLVAPALYRQLGCEVIELFCDLDGNFPHHHPDPSRPEHLSHLQLAVKAQGADLGLAFDGDGDRLGVVDDQGQIIWPDRVLMWLAQQLLPQHPGATVLYDVKCSSTVESVVAQAGGQALLCATGHSLMKRRARETGAILAGELSGHLLITDTGHEFDDAIYVGARLLALLAAQTGSTSAAFASIPQPCSTPELLIPVALEHGRTVIAALPNHPVFGQAQIHTIDGVRAEFAAGWGLVRLSNTVPMLTLRFEASDMPSVMEIGALFEQALHALDSELAAALAQQLAHWQQSGSSHSLVSE